MAEDVKPAAALEPARPALVAEPGEPVAWEQRHRENSGEWSKWYPTSKKAFDLIGTEPDGSLQARPLYASPPARQDGALREDAGKVIYRALRDYRMSNMVFESDGDPYCLVDLVSADGKSIADGENELELIAAAVAAALTQAAAPVQPEDK